MKFIEIREKVMYNLYCFNVVFCVLQSHKVIEMSPIKSILHYLTIKLMEDSKNEKNN